MGMEKLMQCDYELVFIITCVTCVHWSERWALAVSITSVGLTPCMYDVSSRG